MAPGIRLESDDERNAIPTSLSFEEVDSDEQVGLDEDDADAVAIIGFSLKFSQEATSSEAFWEMLCEGRSAMTEFPRDRINIDAFYHPDSNRHQTIPVRGGHFIKEDLGVFDAPFFSITPTEAACMDPQQRKLLETSYRALENAGIPMEKCRGSQTSVYTGSFTDDYRSIIFSDPEQEKRYAATGLAASMLANRISWFYDFTGPSMQLDTACSSSLTAVHLACNGLRNGETSMSLVAGSNLVYHPDFMSVMSSMNFLSPDSRCYSFDHRANGYARGEGVAVIVLKMVSQAIRDDDNIRAVIRATGLNQDGRTPGITQPNGSSQEALIRDTYKLAGLNMSHTRFFEAHGTGTEVGDPIEAHAIGNSFKTYRSVESPMHVGAVKSNIGHLEGSSGIAGLIKTIIVLEKGVIPPNTGFECVNPRINPTDLAIDFPVNCIPWPTAGLRRASVNSFGFGGSNAHLVLDDAHHYLKRRGQLGKHSTRHNPPNSLNECIIDTASKNLVQMRSIRTSKPKLFVWTAADESGLERLSTLYGDHFKSHPFTESERCDDIAYTLAVRRSVFQWRSYLVATDHAELQEVKNNLSKAVRSSNGRNAVFVFTGQGAQYAAMGSDLHTYRVFIKSIQESSKVLAELGYEMRKSRKTSNIDDPEYSQTITTALQLALIDLLRSFDLFPAAVIGHSSGEIAAAYCTGALSHASAIKLAFHRGFLAAQLARSTHSPGAMISVGLSEQQIQPYVSRLEEEYSTVNVAIGCINSPANVTMTGDKSHIQRLEAMLKGDSIFVRWLPVNVAYHSQHMQPIAGEYLDCIKDLNRDETFNRKIEMVSTVTGSRILTQELRQSDYWTRNLVSTVRFYEALSRICTQSVNTKRKRLGQPLPSHLEANDLVEIGPHSTLRGPIREVLGTIARGSSIEYHSTLVRNNPSANSILKAAGRLYCLGYPIDLLVVNQASDECCVVTGLPEYPLNHSQSHWIEPRASKGFRLRKHGRHDLLGTPEPDWNPLEARWNHVVRLSENPWIEDHKIGGVTLYPAAGILVMAIEAAKQVADEGRRINGFQIKDASFFKALRISLGPEGVETQFHLRSAAKSMDQENVWAEFRLYVREDGEWEERSRGLIQTLYQSPASRSDGDNERNQQRQVYKKKVIEGVKNCEKDAATKELYDLLRNFAADYGPSFQVLDHLSYNNSGEVTAELQTRRWAFEGNESFAQPHTIHPTTLDGLFQLIYPALSQCGGRKMPRSVPTRVQSLWMSCEGLNSPEIPSIRIYGESQFKGYRESESTILGTLTNGELCISLEGVEATFVSNDSSDDSMVNGKRRLCCHLDWKPDLDLMSNKQILQYCENTRPKVQQPVNFYMNLRLIMLYFIRNAVEMIAGTHHSSLEPHLGRYVEWMEKQSSRCETGELAIDQDGWTRIREDPQNREDLIKHIEETSSEGRFYMEVGRNLTSILDGVVSPLDLLFHSDLADNYYRELNSAPHFFTPFATYLATLAHKSPAMRILEIGAGTGGATLTILKTLTSGDKEDAHANFSHYDFTDISPALFANAQEKFKHHVDRIDFKTLDIEHDPANQGFDSGSYDLVVASNVLHATPDIIRTLENARKLLKNGGKMVLFEVTEPHMMRTGFVFGLLKGWWLTTDKLRQWSPCLSEKAWDDALKQTGFSGVDIILPDHHDAACHESSIIVTTALEVPLNTDSRPKAIIVADNAVDHQRLLACQLQHQILDQDGHQTCQILSLKEAAESRHLSSSFGIMLCEAGGPFLSTIATEDFTYLQRFLTSIPCVVWVTQNSESDSKDRRPELEMVTGLARALRSEFIQLKFCILALQTDIDSLVEACKMIMKVVDETLAKSVEDYEPEYKQVSGILHVSRVMEADYLDQAIFDKTAPAQRKAHELGGAPPLSLYVPAPGLLDSLEFREDPGFSQPLASNEVSIEVKATGINFRDCLLALGRLTDTDLGTECSGIVTEVGQQVSSLQKGDRVCVCAMGTFRTIVRCKAECVARISQALSFVEAASLPTASLTVYHALLNVARMRIGQSILIHSGAGGTGQMAIQIAQHVQAKIYVTVGSESKKKLLMDTYGLDEDCIFYSRDTSFAQGIKRVTQDRGVDVILNCLSGESLLASWECIAPFGRFVEIGKRDIASRSELPMAHFGRNVAFAAVDLSGIIRERPSLLQELFQGVTALVEQGELRPASPLNVYPASQITQAFRSLQSGKNMGKIVIEYKRDDAVPALIDSKPSLIFHEQATYLIAGGFGGLGRSIAKWMASRGARYLILLSRSGPKSEAAKSLMSKLQEEGVCVEAPACDITVIGSLNNALEYCMQRMPPIKGCIQGTMVLRDTIFENMTFDDFTSSTRPKVAGSWNLHAALPKGLDFFVLLSSICGIFGGPSQSNYAAGNTYKDALAHYRVSQGEQGASLDLGMMTGEGVVAENQSLQSLLKRTGFFMEISQAELFAILEYYCDPALDLSSTPQRCQAVVGIELPGVLRAHGIDEPYWMRRPLFRHFHQMNTNVAGTDLQSAQDDAPDYSTLLRNAASPGEAAGVVSEGLVGKMSKILGLPLANIDTGKPVHAYGVDSLIAVELRNWLLRQMQADVAVFEILGNASLEVLCGGIVEKSGYYRKEG